MQPSFDHAADVLHSYLQEQPPDISAQVCVIHRREIVLDTAGSSPGSSGITTDTPFITFSVTKAFTAAAVWHLLDAGKIELDAPIASYWPEFGQKGKATATIRHALLHQAGIPAPHLYSQILCWPFWRLVTRHVARSQAEFPPGAYSAYHLVNFGFILGEVVRRVSGMPVDQYLVNTFFVPMGLEHTWMRLPPDKLHLSPRLLALHPQMRSIAGLFNLPAIRKALIPAAGLHSCARELASFFQMLLADGECRGKRYLMPGTIREAARVHYSGYDHFIKTNMNWGLGLIMGGPSPDTPNDSSSPHGYGSSGITFSAMGMGTCMVWADRRAELVTAFTCNGMLSDNGTASRWALISNAVWDCLQG